jgi:hypothetical protein
MTMMVIPTDKDVPLIQDVQGTPAEIAARADAFFKSAELIRESGGDVEPTEAERDEARLIFSGSELAPQVPSSSAVARQLKALITEYDHQVIESNIQARNYIVNRLLELSDPSGNTKPMEQLRALELMGKVSEIGLFTERLEVNINNKSTEELEKELVATLNKYINVVDVVPTEQNDPRKPLGIDLDEELGRKPKAAEPENGVEGGEEVENGD